MIMKKKNKHSSQEVMSLCLMQKKIMALNRLLTIVFIAIENSDGNKFKNEKKFNRKYNM